MSALWTKQTLATCAKSCERVPGGFRVDDAEGKALAYCSGLKPKELPVAGQLSLTIDETKRIASNIGKLPEPLNSRGRSHQLGEVYAY